MLKNEFVIVQGIVDLAVILPGEIWVIDFKTDEIRHGDLVAKTRSVRAAIEIVFDGAFADLSATGHGLLAAFFISRRNGTHPLKPAADDCVCRFPGRRKLELWTKLSARGRVGIYGDVEGGESSVNWFCSASGGA